MATLYEYYLTGEDNSSDVTATTNWRGQTFTPSVTHTIGSIKLHCQRVGSSGLPGTVTVQIKATDGSGLPTGAALVSGTTNGDTLPLAPATAEWRVVTLGAGASLTAGTKYAMVWSASAADANNVFRIGMDATSPTYSSGNMVFSNDSQTTYAALTYDAMFEEWLGVASNDPSVTTQSVTAISGTTATGNGNITYLGTPTATQHGHCWNTTGTPTTVDSKTLNGVPSATGAFTSSITGLTAGTLYYVRTYITNSTSTYYGNEQTFTAAKGDVYPTDPITRVSGITRTFWSGAGGLASYQAQLFCGGVSPTYVPLVSPRTLPGVEPEPQTVTQAYAKAGPGYQQEDYLKWLLTQSKGTGPTVDNPYGYVMTYEQWLIMKGKPPRNGWPGFGIK